MSGYGEAVVVKVSLVCSNEIESAPQAEQLELEGRALAEGVERAIRTFFENEALELNWQCKITKSGPAS